MRIVAIKNMSAGNDSVGEMWNETKIFHHTDLLLDVMKWVGGKKKNIILTIPDNDNDDWCK